VWAYQGNFWRQRDHRRRSELASWLILILFVCDTCALVLAVIDLQNLIAVGAIGILLTVAAGLNRRGHVTAVGWLLTIGLALAMLSSATPENSVIGNGALDKDMLPIYDLLAIPLVISMALVKPRVGVWVAGAFILIIIVHFIVQPHTPNLEQEILVYGGPLTGTAVLLVRPIILQMAMVVIVNLLVRGVLRAQLEALRAEQDAELSRRLAQLQTQQLNRVSAFADQVRDAIRTGQAITLPPDHPLAEVAALFNASWPSAEAS
jgi:hypothetical protein